VVAVQLAHEKILYMIIPVMLLSKVLVLLCNRAWLLCVTISGACSTYKHGRVSHVLKCTHALLQ